MINNRLKGAFCAEKIRWQPKHTKVINTARDRMDASENQIAHLEESLM